MNNPSNQLQTWWREGNFPLTKAIIALNFLTLTLITFRVPLVDHLIFMAPYSLREPWTLLTYPLVSDDIIWTLFYGLWLLSIGAALERAWGTKTFAIAFFAMAVLEGLSVALAALITGTPVIPPNWLPLAVLGFTYYMLMPYEIINVWGVIQTQARWIALVDVLIIFFVIARSHPLAGFFALSGCALSYWWIKNGAWSYSAPRRSRAKQQTTKRNRRDDDFSWRDLNPIERIQRARRRKQFARLIEEDEKIKRK